MPRKKKTKIYEIRGKTFEECKIYHDWIHQGKIAKNTSVFIPLSDDYEGPDWHNAVKIMEESGT